jgi:hypothetical protein
MRSPLARAVGVPIRQALAVAKAVHVTPEGVLHFGFQRVRTLFPVFFFCL